MNTIRRIIALLQNIRAIFHIVLFRRSPAKVVIAKDLERWLKEAHEPEQPSLPNWKALVFFVWRYPEFRNLFYYRIGRDERITTKILLRLAEFLFRPMDTLYFRAPTIIGAGLFIQHGYSTGIAARSIGENCWINQQVTIGYSNLTDRPTIGDNVRIAPGARVFGNITIGNNSIIGANAVVLKNVPANCTVVGVPAYIVRRDGKKVKESL